jgi:hypothetical protein
MPVVRALALLSLAALAARCGGSDPPADVSVSDGPTHILARPESLAVQPSQSALITFRLLDDHDSPIADRIIQFSIVDDPATAGDEARGSTLSFDRGVTDADGQATLQVIAGPEPTAFRVRASAARAMDTEVPVRVDMAPYAPLEVAPLVPDDAVPGMELTTVRLNLLEGMSCADITSQDIPKGLLPTRTLPIDTVALYSAVNTEANHAAAAVGLDASGTVRAVGCVDVPGSILVVESPVRVVLPLRLLELAPVGRYQATSHLSFRMPPPGGAQLADAWGALSLCPMDPARLWLDCTLDALHTDASDPSDCRPAEDEGALGGKLAQRRGVPLPVPASGRCRDRVDAAGRMSHDALVDGLFPRTRPPIVTGLPALASESRQLLAALDLRSVLTISATSTPDRYQIDHTLLSLAFPQAPREAVVDLARLGAPVIQARFVPATARGSDLAISSHAFTLRLGTAAWLAFADTSLRPRGAGTDVTTFSNALFGLATRDDRGATLSGCAALDALLCPDVGEARGCLLAACTDGLAALGRQLTAGFSALDGDDLDLVLGGSVPVLDRDGDGKADALGVLNLDTSSPGLWSGDLRSRGGPSAFAGIWTAQLVAR